MTCTRSGPTLSETVIATPMKLCSGSARTSCGISSCSMLVGRCPSCYPPGAFAALKDRRILVQSTPDRIHGQAKSSWPAGKRPHRMHAHRSARMRARDSPGTETAGHFDNSASLAWPPPRPSFAAASAMSMIPRNDRRYTADWTAARDEDNARRLETEKRWTKGEEKR